MTNEEKEAVEKLRNTSKQCHNSKECWENEDCTDCYVEVEDIMAIDTVLKLLKEKDNRIKELESDKEIKDKMIELMLEELTDCEFEMKCSECCCECEKDYDQLYECNKQYFENKAKESGDENAN